MSRKLRKESFRPTDETEEEYTEFYSDILKRFFNFENPQLAKRFKESLYVCIRTKCSERSLKKIPGCQIQYYSKESRCAYIYQYSVLHSKMVSYHFTNFLMESIRTTQNLLKKKRLTLCCLGGGPALEAVAIIKVLNDLMRNMKSICITDIDVTIVDKCPEWKEECLAILESVKENARLDISKNINISVEFIKANLLKEIGNDLSERIKEADIVTMVKFVNELQKLLPTNTSKRIREMIMNVASNMKDEGCFFMVDNGGGGIPTEFRSVFNGILNWQKLYGPAEHKLHFLQGESIRIFQEFLPGNSCSKETLVYSCAWRKREPRSRKEVQK